MILNINKEHHFRKKICVNTVTRTVEYTEYVNLCWICVYILKVYVLMIING
jgi:hypothetical protein